MTKSILITGANGFIGKSLVKFLLKRNFNITGVVRDKKFKNKNIKVKYLKSINNDTNWDIYFAGIDIVIHTAGLAGTNNIVRKNLVKLNEINVSSTINLAEQAAKYKIKKFIFISSAQVHGETSCINKPLTVKSKYNPESEYAMSKVEAEKGLANIRKISKMDIIIIRPPLVYGHGVKSNFSTLIHLVKQKKLFPFKLVCRNKLSFISLENLNDFIHTCITYQKIINENFLIRDPNLVSTKVLIEEIADAFEVKPKLFPAPIIVLRLLGFLFNKRKQIKQLTSNFEIDMSFTKRKLNWKPKIDTRSSLRKMKKN